MRRIVVGEFKSMKTIEKLMMKDLNHFGLYADFESAKSRKVTEDEGIEWRVFLDDLKTFNRHHEWIRTNREQIVLLLASREMKLHGDFLESEGYRVESLSSKRLRRKKTPLNRLSGRLPRTVMVSGNYEMALKWTVVAAEAQPRRCLLTDLSQRVGLSDRRVDLPTGQEWHYLSEHLARSGGIQPTRIRGVDIVPTVSGTDWSTEEEIAAVVRWLDGQVTRYDFHVIHVDSVPGGISCHLADHVEQIVAFSGLSYEALVRSDSWIRQSGGARKGGIVGVGQAILGPAHFMRMGWIETDILGIMRPPTDGGRKRIRLESLSVREKEEYKKLCRVMMTDGRGR